MAQLGPKEAGQGLARSGVFCGGCGTQGARMWGCVCNSPMGLVGCVAPQSAFPRTGSFHLLIRSRLKLPGMTRPGAPILGNPPIWKLLNSDCLKYSPLISRAAHSGEGAECCSEYLGNTTVEENNWGPQSLCSSLHGITLQDW